jgi:SAM-dependent methyltransferase
VDQARAALQLAQARAQAINKFGADAGQLFFTPEAVQQASDPLVSRYRAAGLAGQQVVDAGCGVGMDALALARAGAQVIGFDMDPVRVAMARLNAQASGLTAQFEVHDVRTGLPPADLIFFDPARRAADGKRLYDVERYHPPLSTLTQWSAPRLMVKLSPGVQLEQLARYDAHVEFISVQGDLKEAVLHLGDGRTGCAATYISPSETLHWPPPQMMPDVPVTEPRACLVEPDPALLRAGLVQAVAAAYDGTLLDATIAYFTTDICSDTSWVRCWRILDWMPFQLKRLRAYLREQGVGRVTVKKRGMALTPEELIPRLRLQGQAERTLVLTRLRGQPVVLICVGT